jgi:hypothetical protein
MPLRRCSPPYLLLLVSLFIGCESPDPLGPTSGGPRTAPTADPTAPPHPTLQPTISTTPAASGATVNAPSRTNAVAVSQSRIDVFWQDNSSNETGFEVHRSTNGPGGAFAFRVVLGAGVTNYTELGLPALTQYCYEVRAFRTTGRKTSYSLFAPAACATTPAPPPPAAPSDADATPVGSTRVWVSWSDKSTNEGGFRVERSLDLGATWATAGTTGANEYSISDGGRNSEQQVCYRVIAFNGGGDSPPSSTDCTTPPAGPTNLIATIVDAETMEVELTWTDNSAVEDGYIVGVDPCCGPGVLPANLPANSTSFRFGWGFYADGFYVIATKDGGYSDPSNSVVPTVP